MGAKYNDAQKRATKQYMKKHEQIKITVPEGKRAEYQAKADAAGKSLTQFIIDLLENA